MSSVTIMKPRKKKRNWAGFFLLMPIMALILLFKYVPLFGWYLSLIEYKVGKPILECKFVGLANFKGLFKMAAFSRAFTNTLIYSFAKYVMLFLPPIFAILLNEITNRHFKKIVQTITTLPHFISWIIIYGLAYHSHSGL